ncbi:MAG: hypothetical protein ACR2HJ_05590 [Fimbriimonadales bacterium]
MNRLSGTWKGALEVGNDPGVESMARGLASSARLTLQRDGTFMLRMVDTQEKGTWELEGRIITTRNVSVQFKGDLQNDATVHQYRVSQDDWYPII